MTESKLQKECFALATKKGVLARKVHCEGRRGWPDVELLFPGGKVVWVEMKHPNGRGAVGVLQEREHAKIRKLGGVVYVCDSLEEFETILNNHR